MFVTPCHRRLRPPTRRHIGQTRTDQPRLQKAGNPWSQRGEIRSPQYYVGKGSGRLPPAAMRAAVLALEAATPTGLAHSGPWRPGYLRLPAPPMPPRSSWPPRPRHHATTAIPQTGSTAEHATTPEHPCPGVVARTGPQAVNPSPVSGESMASGGYACGARIPTTNLTGERRRRCRRYSARWPPTRDGRSLRQAAPGCLLPRGRTRTGLEVETPTRSMGPMANKEVRG
jgi:hypothetical protein